MFAFFATLIILSIIITLVQAAFGIKSSQSPSLQSAQEEYLPFYSDNYYVEIQEEMAGLRDHGHGRYDPR